MSDADGPEASLLASHGPENWSEELPLERAGAVIDTDRPVWMIVMAADIRGSTLMMKEAVSFREFAASIGYLVGSVRSTLRGYRGWFDKFTGDGFLAYWIVDERAIRDYAVEVLASANAVIEAFRKQTEPYLRDNSKNFPARVGISVGLDAGPGYLARIAGDLTILGAPVVGAVRMVAAAEPYEAIANVYLGRKLLAAMDVLEPFGITLAPVVRRTKEYEQGQQVFVVNLPG